jgi:hypothetical protein
MTEFGFEFKIQSGFNFEILPYFKAAFGSVLSAFVSVAALLQRFSVILQRFSVFHSSVA